MKYSQSERLEIGRKIYLGEMTRAEAALQYDINIYTARDYLRLYKASVDKSGETISQPKYRISMLRPRKIRKRYEEMSKEELIDELMKLRLNKQ